MTLMIKHRDYEHGAVNGYLIAVILLTVSVVALVGLSVWLFIHYNDQKNNVDSKVEVAVAEAVRQTKEKEYDNFLEREKEPNREFVGPDDYGRLTFSYPKTWSVYVAEDVTTSGSSFKAYLNPITVPPVSGSEQRFALRVLIEDRDVDTVINSYSGLVKKGDLKSSPTSANGVNGTRLDGSFNKNIRGAVVIYKVRDKTVSLFTDADTFKPDFENIIKTIKFNS